MNYNIKSNPTSQQKKMQNIRTFNKNRYLLQSLKEQSNLINKQEIIDQLQFKIDQLQKFYNKQQSLNNSQLHYINLEIIALQQSQKELMTINFQKDIHKIINRAPTTEFVKIRRTDNVDVEVDTRTFLNLIFSDNEEQLNKYVNQLKIQKFDQNDIYFEQQDIQQKTIISNERLNGEIIKNQQQIKNINKIVQQSLINSKVSNSAQTIYSYQSLIQKPKIQQLVQRKSEFKFEQKPILPRQIQNKQVPLKQADSKGQYKTYLQKNQTQQQSLTVPQKLQQIQKKENSNIDLGQLENVILQKVENIKNAPQIEIKQIQQSNIEFQSKEARPPSNIHHQNAEKSDNDGFDDDDDDDNNLQIKPKLIIDNAPKKPIQQQQKNESSDFDDDGETFNQQKDDNQKQEINTNYNQQSNVTIKQENNNNLEDEENINKQFSLEINEKSPQQNNTDQNHEDDEIDKQFQQQAGKDDDFGFLGYDEKPVANNQDDFDFD